MHGPEIAAKKLVQKLFTQPHNDYRSVEWSLVSELTQVYPFEKKEALEKARVFAAEALSTRISPEHVRSYKNLCTAIERLGARLD